MGNFHKGDPVKLSAATLHIAERDLDLLYNNANSQTCGDWVFGASMKEKWGMEPSELRKKVKWMKDRQSPVENGTKKHRVGVVGEPERHPNLGYWSYRRAHELCELNQLLKMVSGLPEDPEWMVKIQRSSEISKRLLKSDKNHKGLMSFLDELYELAKEDRT